MLTLLLALGGCARQAPQSSDGPTTSPTATALVVGATGDETSRVLAELYVQGLAAKGRTARVVEVDDDANSQVSRLMAGEVDLVPAFAWTAAQTLAVDSDDPKTLVSDLAAALDGEVAVVQPSKVDRAWRFVATTPDGSLAALPTNATIAADSRWKDAPDGLSGLEAVYRAKPSVEIVGDATQRLARVKAGAIGVFTGTDPQVADPSVHQLDDPLSMVTSDPQVALVRIEVSTDDTVLDVVQQLHAKLDDAAVIGIRVRAASVGAPSAVGEWLEANPLT